MTICRHCGQMAGTGRYCGNCGIAQHMGVHDPGTAPPAQLLWQALPIGLKLQRRYTVLRLLSRGSFGAVYEVEDERFAGQRRALKELVPVALEAEEFAESGSTRKNARRFKRRKLTWQECWLPGTSESS